MSRFLLVTAVLATSTPAVAGDYVVINLPGARWARDIAAVGQRAMQDLSAGAVGTTDAIYHDFSPHGSADSAYGVNIDGEIVGWSSATNEAAMWSDGATTLLGVPSGHARSQATAISDAGHVVGHSEMSFGLGYRGFVWTEDVGMVGLAPRLATYNPDWRRSIPHDVNERGVIVGETSAGDHDAWSMQAAAWTVTPAGTVAGPFLLGQLGTDASNTSEALAINNDGLAVGRAEVDGGLQHAVTFSPGGPTDLGVLPGDTWSEALDVNDDGEVVGSSGGGPSATGHAFVVRDGVMEDLNDLVVSGHGFAHLESAGGIGDDGAITGVGVRSTGAYAHYLALPTDLPLTLVHVTDLVAGWRTNDAIVFGTPGETITLVGGAPSGRTRVPGCGSSVALSHVTVLGTAVAGPDGVATIAFDLPWSVAGLRVGLAAVERGTCTTSPVSAAVAR